MENNKEMVVSAIENGTVIDHIPTEAVYQVIRILGPEHYKDEVLIGNYLDSLKLGKKGIVKIKNKHFSEGEVSKIALVAPFASIIDIEDYKVVRKFKAEIPDHIEDFVRCASASPTLRLCRPASTSSTRRTSSSAATTARSTPPRKR